MILVEAVIGVVGCLADARYLLLGFVLRVVVGRHCTVVGLGSCLSSVWL
jgi:hypothetical protein